MDQNRSHLHKGDSCFFRKVRTETKLREIFATVKLLRYNSFKHREVFSMQEPEVSLRIAMKFIQENKTCSDIRVSLDGAHIKTKDTIHFDITSFMNQNGYVKCDSDNRRWQGIYRNPHYTHRIVISSKPGIGDVVIVLSDGKTLFIESKKLKHGSGGEYPAMREAIGQLMTSCPDDPNVIPIVAVPLSEKSAELAQIWSANERIRRAGIHFMLVRDSGSIDFK